MSLILRSPHAYLMKESNGTKQIIIVLLLTLGCFSLSQSLRLLIFPSWAFMSSGLGMRLLDLLTHSPMMWAMMILLMEIIIVRSALSDAKFLAVPELGKRLVKRYLILRNCSFVFFIPLFFIEMIYPFFHAGRLEKLMDTRIFFSITKQVVLYSFSCFILSCVWHFKIFHRLLLVLSILAWYSAVFMVVDVFIDLDIHLYRTLFSFGYVFVLSFIPVYICQKKILERLLS